MMWSETWLKAVKDVIRLQEIIVLIKNYFLNNPVYERKIWDWPVAV